jgi:ribonuclease HI
VELAETNGLREALDIIEKNNLHQVSILMDAACIVQAINNKTFPRSQGALQGKRHLAAVKQRRLVYKRCRFHMYWRFKPPLFAFKSARDKL